MPLVRGCKRDAKYHRPKNGPGGQSASQPSNCPSSEQRQDYKLGVVPTLDDCEPGKAPKQSEPLHRFLPRSREPGNERKEFIGANHSA